MLSPFHLIVWLFVFALGTPGAVLAAQSQKVRLSYSSRSNSVTPFQVAAVKGFFKEEGLDVEMIQVNPRLGAMAVMNGDLDFTSTFGSTLRGVLQGLPLKFVAVSVKKSEHFLVTRRDIKDVSELKGKKIAVSTLLGTDQVAAEEILRSKGFNPALLQPLAVGDAPLRAQALRTGLVDASSISSPHDLLLKDEGFNVLGGPEDVKYALPTTEGKKPLADVRDFTLLRQAQKELGIRQ